MEKVSIIVAVYNVEKYLSNCTQSLINQTYENIEIILVDDGSIDSSAAFCDDLALKDSRIKVKHKENGGLSSARNAGLDIATGEYIMFVDGDDYLSQNAVEVLIKLAEENTVDFIQFDYLETEKDCCMSLNSELPCPEIVDDTKSMFDRLYAVGGAAASACTKFYKKAIFNELSFKEGIIHEDEYFTTRLLQKCKSVMYIQNKLYFYVIRQNSIVTSKFSPKKFDFLLVCEDRMENLKNLKYYDLLEKEKAKYFINVINIWCFAKNAGDKASVKKAAKHINNIIKNPIMLTGKFKFLYKLCKINVNFLFVYYFYKKLTKQV